MPGLADFGAWDAGKTLRLVGCGHGNDLAERVRDALDAIPSVSRVLAAHSIQVDIIIRPDYCPAVPGLGKRKIQTDQEN